MRLLFVIDKMNNYAGIERILSCKMNHISEQTTHQIFLTTYEQQSENLPFRLSEKITYHPINATMPQWGKPTTLGWLKAYLHARCHFKQQFKLLIKNIKPDLVICTVYYNVVILDADNVVRPDFLSQLNILCSIYDAIQCHRCAKNANNDVAVLDGTSEEINNTIFRKAHNRLGLSSALIGSGMCFDYELFKKNVFQLSTAGEDREMEALLLHQEIFIKYAPDIHVFDEKVSSQEDVWKSQQRQQLYFR